MSVKILIVDDTDANLKTLRAVLQSPKYELVCCKSGREALKLLIEQEGFSCILLDVQMPELNGYEVARLIRADPKIGLTPIVFLTAGKVDERGISEGYGAGAVDYLIKPFDPDILKSKVKVFVDLYLRNQDLIEKNKMLEQLSLELKSANTELEKFNQIALGRERRIIELKRQVNELARSLHKPPPYDVAFAEIEA